MRFSAASYVAEAVDGYGTLDPTLITGFAGKYRQGYCTPFDLAKLAARPEVESGQLDLSSIKYVRLVDVRGDGTEEDCNDRPVYESISHEPEQRLRPRRHWRLLDVFRSSWPPRLLVRAFAVATAVVVRSEAQVTPVIVDAHTTKSDRRSSRDATTDSVVVRQEELATPGTSTAQILSKTTGAQIRQSGGTLEPTQLVLRGGTSAQLPIYLGDVLLNDETQGAANLSLLPPTRPRSDRGSSWSCPDLRR
ncbi:MAG: TonB-dependent receptor plug domain-containing protein [Polyangiaceae bacterium]